MADFFYVGLNLSTHMVLLEHKSGKQIIWTPSYDSFLPSGGDQAFETGLQKVLS
jgi:general stress protein 26